jgi:hypothetical protein
VQQPPEVGSNSVAFGIAEYRAGNFSEAVEALERAAGRNAHADLRRRFVLAMAYWQLGRKGQARQAYDQCIEWMEKRSVNTPEIYEFRAEAGALMGIRDAAPSAPDEVPPGLEQGVAAAFYAGVNHDRFVVAKRVSRISFCWRREPPAPNVPVDRFSTRIVGWLYIPEAGEQTFVFDRDDGARLYIDGKRVINEWKVRSPGTPCTVQLTAGWHRLWVEHMDYADWAQLSLAWRRGQWAGLVPSGLLYCERELLERIRRDPTQDPFAGLSPTDPVALPEKAERPAGDAEKPTTGGK